ncbi:hypothetical protein VCR12J2_60060 [Vibrio coralliirubri]|nr:hypothetical protein VCR12J2_60060 [Vibrio coralliirubri]
MILSEEEPFLSLVHLSKLTLKFSVKMIFKKNAQSPCSNWSESGSEKVLSSYVFKPLKIATKSPQITHQNLCSPNGQSEQLRKANGTRIQCRQHQGTKT